MKKRWKSLKGGADNNRADDNRENEIAEEESSGENPQPDKELQKESKTETGKRKKQRKTGGGKKRLFLMILIILIAFLAAGFLYGKGKTRAASAAGTSVRTAAVERRDITSTLSSSGTIAPKDTYTITSMADGEVIEASFEEGDQVTEGQILYRIDASSMESKLRSANNSVDRSQSNYEDAVKDYNEAVGKYSGNTYKSTRTGYIKTLHITEGDKVSSNTQIADLYNDQIMKIKVPFLNLEAEQISVGAEAILTLSDTQEQIAGTVISVSSLDETLTGGRLIRHVTLQVENPGGLTTDMAATAQIGVFYSSGDGTFTPTVDTVMAADLSSGVEIQTLLVNEGDFVSVGSPIFQMKADDAQKLIKSYKDSMDSAQSSLEQAQSSLDTTQDNYDDYTITAPISGTVIKKNGKVGDKVQNGNSATSLAEIYDMSSVTFDMNIDELDIGNVKVGQNVTVTADAFANQTFSGKVTKVSLEGTSSNGVTYYPVTVALDDPGSFLPGMNVDGEIILDSAKQAIAVPAGFRQVEVETGLISSDYVEIKSGDLREGDEVYISQSSVSSAGQTMMMPAMSMDGPQGGGQSGGNSSRRNSGNGGSEGYGGESGGSSGGKSRN